MSGDGKLIPLDINPGINKDVTEYAAEGYWVACDKIRFRDMHPEKLGGWVHEQAVQVSDATRTTFHGIARDIEVWTDLRSVKYLALGTNEKLEVLTGGLYYDITPIVTTVSINNAFSTSIGSPQVIVSIISHPGNPGDYIVFSSVNTTVGGNILLDSQYVITSIISSDAFLVSAVSAATATAISGGGSGSVQFLLPTGLQSNGAAYGWGAGTWGRGGWGTPASSGVPVRLAQWSLDTFGEDLLACREGGYLYRWSTSAGPLVRASIVAAAPSVNNIIMVHNPTKHVMSFGCTDISGIYDPLLIRWSDQDNINDWISTVSNSAGDYPLQGGNRIVAVQQTQRETVILTDDVVNIMRFTGDESVFSFERAGAGSGAISPHCVVDANGIVYWMGFGSFYKYTGSIKALDTTVDKYIFRPDSDGSINVSQKEKVFAAINSMFNEIIWLYPSRDSVEIDRYVIHNYLDNLWYIGTLDRTVWADVGIFEKPYAASSQSVLYIHEEGFNDDANILDARLESGWFDIDNGDDLLFTDRIIPDVRRLNGKNLSITIQVKKYPESTEVITKGPYMITDSTQKISLRARGRQAKVIIEQSVTDGSFEIGNMRAALQPDGKR